MKAAIIVLAMCGCALARGHFHDGRRYNLPYFPKQELFLDPNPEQIQKARRIGNRFCPVDLLPIGSKPNAVIVVYKGDAITLESATCKPEFGRRPDLYQKIAVADSADADSSGAGR